MAHSHDHLGADMKPLSEIPNYTIEKGDPDPRGYSVVSGDGTTIGRVEDLIVDTSAMKVRYLVVDLNDDGGTTSGSERTILLPAEGVDVRDDGNQVIARNYTGTEAAYARQTTTDRDYTDRQSTDGDYTDHDRTLTRSEEELEISKREVSRGEVRVGKHVETERVSQPVTRRHEEVVIERRPVEAGTRASAEMSDDEVRIPLMEEEVIVEKRPVVKEELVIGKRVVEERDTVETEVRREEFDIDETARAATRTRGKGDQR
jgi:uncharacterized protein (TIGR02271 family)